MITARAIVTAQAAKPAHAFIATKNEPPSEPPNADNMTTVSEAIAIHASAKLTLRSACTTGSEKHFARTRLIISIVIFVKSIRGVGDRDDLVGSGGAA